MSIIKIHTEQHLIWIASDKCNEVTTMSVKIFGIMWKKKSLNVNHSFDDKKEIGYCK